MKQRWTKTDDIAVYDARIFTLRRASYLRGARTDREAETGTYHYIDSYDWVNIVPLTTERRVILIRQFRIGVDDFIIETPGGMVDPADASPLEAARRELREETGYGSDEIIPIGRSHPNPATQNNSVWFFAALGVRKIGEQRLDPGEDIELEVMDLADVDRLIAVGRITHALALNAFDFLKRKFPEFGR